MEDKKRPKKDIELRFSGNMYNYRASKHCQTQLPTMSQIYSIEQNRSFHRWKRTASGVRDITKHMWDFRTVLY